MSIENNFDVPFIAGMALREKQIQQNYRPIIAVHKWFARRPGTLFRALALSEFGSAPLAEIYFEANDFPGRAVLDPFMGGGIPLIEANRIGCDVTGFDINPMAAWIVREEIEHLDVEAYRKEANRILIKLRESIGEFYVTDCPLFGDAAVPVKYFLWVKTTTCEACQNPIDLFPGYVVSESARHPKNVLVCRVCGDLNEVDDLKIPGTCRSCGVAMEVEGPAKRGRCACPHCKHVNKYPRPEMGPLSHRLFAIEYFNPKRKSGHKGRFFKKPDAKDLARAAAATDAWQKTTPRFVPTEEILAGDETDRLHKWGYSHYRQLFGHRQLLALELCCRSIEKVADGRLRHALSTNLSDILRYQNMLCRYDTWALKSLDIFSVHGFPVGLVQCESNFIGIVNENNINIGSGGWTNIIDKYYKAKRYCDAPFEVKRQGKQNVQIPVRGEWIGEGQNGARRRKVKIRCGDSATVKLAAQSYDAVFTDPPYFGNVQYGELMDFCYVWLRRLAGAQSEGFDRVSSRAPEELTGNATKGRGLDHFAQGLGEVYSKMGQALKPGAPLAFTFHHNNINAYFAVGVAILDAGLTCSASLPCPAEMGGSIHIHGTASSIVDTIFVCRTRGHTRRQWLFKSVEQLVAIVATDIQLLLDAGYKATSGDTRCILFGHITRMAAWNLRKGWNRTLAANEKLRIFEHAVLSLPNTEHVIGALNGARGVAKSLGPLFSVAESHPNTLDAIPF